MSRPGSRFRFLVVLIGESFILFVFFSQPHITLESVAVTLGSIAALFLLWRYCERP